MFYVYLGTRKAQVQAVPETNSKFEKARLFHRGTSCKAITVSFAATLGNHWKGISTGVDPKYLAVDHGQSNSKGIGNLRGGPQISEGGNFKGNTNEGWATGIWGIWGSLKGHVKEAIWIPIGTWGIVKLWVAHRYLREDVGRKLNGSHIAISNIYRTRVYR